MNKRDIRLVAFDVDGTLVHGETLSETLARRVGYLARMQEIERIQEEIDFIPAREEIASWFRSIPFAELCTCLQSIRLAPGVKEGLALLKRHQIKIALVSITWEFAVEWLAQKLGADYFVGTRLSIEGDITHFWAQDKASWLCELAQQLDLHLEQIAAVGDSNGDRYMLRTAGYGFFVGKTVPTGLTEVYHYPDGNIHTIAQHIIDIAKKRTEDITDDV